MCLVRQDPCTTDFTWMRLGKKQVREDKMIQGNMVYKLLLILVIQCGGNFETIYGQQYEKKTSGKCQYDITCFNECEAAAIALGFSDTSATDDKQDNGPTGVTYDPKGCYYEGGSLKFNARISFERSNLTMFYSSQGSQ